MKWERTDLIVGIVVVTTAAILAGTLLWILPALSQRAYPLYTYLNNVDDIAPRAPVQLSGYRIGFVETIEPQVTSTGDVTFRISMAINGRIGRGQEFVLPLGTEALLTPPPLPIGAGVIALILPSEAGPPLDPGATIPGRRAPVAADQLQALTASLDRQVSETTAAARMLMDSLTYTTGVMNRSLLTTQAAIPPVINDLRIQLAAAEALTQDLRTHLNTLGPSAVAGIDSATALLADSRQMVQRMNGIMGTSEQEIHSILANLDTTSVLVQTLVRQLSDRPLRTIMGGVRPAPPYSRPQ